METVQKEGNREVKRAINFYIEQFRDSAELLARAIVPDNNRYVTLNEYTLNKYRDYETID